MATLEELIRMRAKAEAEGDIKQVFAINELIRESDEFRVLLEESLAKATREREATVWLRCPCCLEPLAEDKTCPNDCESRCSRLDKLSHAQDAYRKWERLNGLRPLPPQPLLSLSDRESEAKVALLRSQYQQWKREWDEEYGRRRKLFEEWREREKRKYYTWQVYKKDKGYLKFKKEHPDKTEEEALRLYDQFKREQRQKEVEEWRRSRAPIIELAKLIARLPPELISQYALVEDAEYQSMMNSLRATGEYFCWKPAPEAVDSKLRLHVTIEVDIFRREKEARKSFQDGILDDFRMMFHQGLPLAVETWLLSEESFRRGALGRFRELFPQIPNVVADLTIGQDCLVIRSSQPNLSSSDIVGIHFFRGAVTISVSAISYQPVSTSQPQGLSGEQFVKTTVEIARAIDTNIIGLGTGGLV